MAEAVLYDYWRSSASYRVRIALNLLGVAYATVPVNLLAGEQRAPDHLGRNPQGLVPVLDIDGLRLTQSLAIVEYLHETRPGGGLLPADPVGRARVRALAHAIAMDIHPVCNTRVVGRLMTLAEDGEAARAGWMHGVIAEGLAAFEAMLGHPATGRFCHGDRPTIADLCLVPQLYNARRWQVDLSAMPRLLAVEAVCDGIDAFRLAAPVAPPS
ncbi:maleylacetoacetate isomerase [Kumtagia ephedrae]|uniref:Maleylacetoacetate isomerase n=1 Tax=Kumtagia ephedrae TaxID=2116701 RepID=A0A2P7S463_9HYPH|nr:maleylacetoacetate isomerase [Mesorhizobium ephedrae]PSJ57219.1 maleylacetoacetate isomerase [Mesorhizobium ephedrae]